MPSMSVRFGPDPSLLVKLLDAGQRLPVHFHPGRAFARDALGLTHGKTEAWVIVEADPGAAVHVGFSRPVAPDEVRDWMRAQDSTAMLAAMHEIPVEAGDAVFVPAGTSHAIGAGILLVELQEPTRSVRAARVGRVRAQRGRRASEPRLGPRAGRAGPDGLGRRRDRRAARHAGTLAAASG